MKATFDAIDTAMTPGGADVLNGNKQKPSRGAETCAR
jgi:hypothetical protein